MDADLVRRVTELEAEISTLKRALTNVIGQLDLPGGLDDRVRTLEADGRERADNEDARDYLSQLDPSELPKA